MPESALPLFALLLAAHVFGDFVLQTSRDVLNKRRLPVLLKHAAIHGVLVMVVLADPNPWPMPALVFATHALLDYAKARWAGESATAFLADQLGHVAILAAIAIAFGRGAAPAAFGWGDALGIGTGYARGLVLLAGLIATVRAGRFLLALFIRPYLDELQVHASGDRPPALHKAGQTIGELERLLIFVLIFADQAGAVGFLIAAKSIFRFGELKESTKRMESEYIIIGTLASFAYAITVALALRALWRVL